MIRKEMLPSVIGNHRAAAAAAAEAAPHGAERMTTKRLKTVVFLKFFKKK